MKKAARTARSNIPRTVLMYAALGLGVGATAFNAACGSSDSGSGSGASSGSGSGGASGSSSGSSSGALTQDGSVKDSSVGEGSAPPRDAGTIILQAIGGGSGEVAAEVTFDEPGVGQERTCTGSVDAGACQLTSCQLGGIGSPGEGYGNFGPISASVGTTTIVLPYDGTGYGTTDFPPSVTLGPGGVMRFRGGHAPDVPTFDVAATIPGRAVITSPVPTTDGGAAIIDTSQDLPVTWLPISIGQIQFELDFLLEKSGSVQGTAMSVACTFEGAAGSGTVPHALLASMKAVSDAADAGLTYGSLSSQLETKTVVDGLTIVTQSLQNTPPADGTFNVTLK